MPIPKPASCNGCPGRDWPCPAPGTGFVPETGTGRNGVLLVFEAAGEMEAQQGVPLVGPAGHQFQQMLTRGRMERDDFKIANVLWCRPPNNYLVGAAYQDAVTQHCAPNLDRVIDSMRPRCIVAGGSVALRRLLPDCPVGIDDARGYVHEYRHRDGWTTWLVPTVHPSRILRGQTSLTAVFIHDLQKAVAIAKDGFQYLDTSFYVLDPTPADALAWVQRFEQLLALRRVAHLSADIETPDKDSNEDALEDPELEDIKDASFEILRCGYSFHDTVTGEPFALSMPWGGQYESLHKRLLESPVDKLWHNKSFDVPRVLADGVLLRGVQHDSMESWHVLNSDLRRSLGTVSSFLCPTMQMWKHLSKEQPAYYNAQDAFAADTDQIKIVEQLRTHGLYRVYDEQILQLDPVFTSMTMAGMPVDGTRRLAFAKELTELQTACRAEMQQLVPDSVRRLEPEDGYKRTPDLDAVRARLEPGEQFVERLFEAQTVRRCSRCLIMNPKKAHFASRVTRTCAICGKRWSKKHPLHENEGTHRVDEVELNPCAGAEVIASVEGVLRWVRVQPFTPSPKQILSYLTSQGHKPEMEGRGEQRRPTTNVKALKKLRARYPQDPLYPLIADDRKLDKLSGTYVGRYEVVDGVERVKGGFPVGRDRRVHAQFTNAPSTLRTSMRSPNLQNLPR